MAQTLKGELRDQAAHFVAAASIVLLCAGGSSLWQAALLGFICGFIRELTEMGTPVSLLKAFNALISSKLDLTFWTLGGAAASMI